MRKVNITLEGQNELNEILNEVAKSQGIARSNRSARTI